MPKFKSAVMKLIACPRCGEKYEIRLGPDEASRRGVETCANSTNKAFARGDSGFIWCGAAVVYEIGRSYTYVGVAAMQEQPSRFRRVPDKQPNVGANRAAEGGPVERPVRPLVEKREDDDA